MEALTQRKQKENQKILWLFFTDSFRFNQEFHIAFLTFLNTFEIRICTIFFF